MTPIIKQFCYVILLAGVASCGTSTTKRIDKKAVEHSTISDETLTVNTEYIDQIKTAYNRFVFAIDSDGDMAPEIYFTANALKKLQDDYEYDCYEGPCYAYYALRTGEQDSKPGSDGTSEILGIEPIDNDWYIVSYSDMGWYGKTRVKIIDGKIDDYERLEQ